MDKNNGSQLEGLTTEIGGLMEQDTNGKVQHIRKKTTNEPDGGIDYVRSVSEDFDYFGYIKELEIEKDGQEEK